MHHPVQAVCNGALFPFEAAANVRALKILTFNVRLFCLK
jgi:hypothetical protein